MLWKKNTDDKYSGSTDKEFELIPHIYKALWYQKIINILNAFVDFDKKRRSTKCEIKSEIKDLTLII